MIQEETYDWIENQMEDAWDLGMNVIPVGHHNLLDESEVYVEDCTIEHSEQLIDQLDSWDVPLFLSGHLHVQHFMREDEDYGIYEIVTSSLATPPCQYGMLDYGDDGSFQYHTVPIDMEAWAKEQGSTDKNLLNFNDIETILSYITEHHFGEAPLPLSQVYTEVFTMEHSQMDKLKDDVKAKFETAEKTFSDVEDPGEKDALQLFSFICELAFDVYLKKQMIERLADEIRDEYPPAKKK